MSEAVILVASFLPYHGSQFQPGGRQRIVRDVARFLRGCGYAIRILQKGDQSSIEEFEPGITVEKVSAPERAWGDALFAWRTRNRVRQSALTCYATPEDGYPFFSPRSFAIHHGVWWDRPFSHAIERLCLQSLNGFRLRALCRRARLVVSVDTHLMNWLRGRGRPGHLAARRCRYLPNYVDLSAFPAPDTADLERRFHSRRLLFLRRFEAPRGGTLFLDLCVELTARGFHFEADMVGWGAEEDQLRQRARNSGLSGRVRFRAGGLEESAQSLSEAALSVIPTRWSEGTSLSALESMAMGVPVVATDVGGLGNVVWPGFNGWLTPCDAPALANAVMEGLTDWEIYRARALAGVSLRACFSRDAWFEQLSRLLKEAGLLREVVQ